MYHGQPWFNLNVPWLARVYKICTLKFAFEVRWLHGTYTLGCSYVHNLVYTPVYMQVCVVQIRSIYSIKLILCKILFNLFAVL